MDTVKIGKFLSELRHEKNLTQEQLGEHLGVTNKTISRWENGNYMPPVEMILEISRFYNISTDEILSGGRSFRPTGHSDSEFDKAENCIKYTENPENLISQNSESAFSIEEKKRYFIKKWKKEHQFELWLKMIVIIFIMAAGFYSDEGILIIIGLLSGFSVSVINHNQMMTYVEKRVFEQHPNC